MKYLAFNERFVYWLWINLCIVFGLLGGEVLLSTVDKFFSGCLVCKREELWIVT